MLKINSPLVSATWLNENLEASNLIILNATIQKVTAAKTSSEIIENQQIKNTFSNQNSEFPNTMLSPQKFTKVARQLGINNNSAIVVYDELGIYSSPRVWWMFKAMGHHNIAVLNGGLPEWKKAGFPIEKAAKYISEKGNFTAKYNQDYISNYYDVLAAISMDTGSVMDARSEGRFNGTEPEPREGLRSGHIPNSINLPYSKLIEEGKMKSEIELRIIFTEFTNKNNRLIFSCGSGITACILALGAEIAGLNNISVYDGSWTEWGSLTDL